MSRTVQRLVIALALFLLAGSTASAAISINQITSATVAGGVTVSVSFAASAPIGDLVVVACIQDDVISFTSITASLAGGGAYTGFGQSGTDYDGSVFYFRGDAGYALSQSGSQVTGGSCNSNAPGTQKHIAIVVVDYAGQTSWARDISWTTWTCPNNAACSGGARSAVNSGDTMLAVSASTCSGCVFTASSSPAVTFTGSPTGSGLGEGFFGTFSASGAITPTVGTVGNYGINAAVLFASPATGSAAPPFGNIISYEPAGCPLAFRGERL